MKPPTIPDYVNGQTDAEPRKLKISFDGEKLVSITEFMDDNDKKEAVSCIRSTLQLYERCMEEKKVLLTEREE